MNKEIEAVVENIPGEQECQIVITAEGGLGFIGRGRIEKIEPGKSSVCRPVGDGKKSYRKVTEEMEKAAFVLVSFGWKGADFQKLFEVNRTTAYDLAAKAGKEHNKRIVEQAIRARRGQAAQEAVKLRDGWQKETKPPEPGLPLGNVRGFRS